MPFFHSLKSGGHNQPFHLVCSIESSTEESSLGLFLSFTSTALLTYLLPCLLLVITNTIIFIKLAQLRANRQLLLRARTAYSKPSNSRIMNSSCHSNVESPGILRTAECGTIAKEAHEGNETGADEQVITSSVAKTLPPHNVTLRSKLNGSARPLIWQKQSKRRQCTITSQGSRRRHEVGRELGRVIAQLLLACFYLIFTTPVAVATCYRASLTNDNSNQCQHEFMGHLTRLLTSVKDINYAVNGYLYSIFFQFYRDQMVSILTCGRVNLSQRRQDNWSTTMELKSSALSCALKLGDKSCRSVTNVVQILGDKPSDRHLKLSHTSIARPQDMQGIEKLTLEEAASSKGKLIDEVGQKVITKPGKIQGISSSESKLMGLSEPHKTEYDVSKAEELPETLNSAEGDLSAAVLNSSLLEDFTSTSADTSSNYPVFLIKNVICQKPS
ncbi:unnamed protein product [Protopolystoma xenopodis]|uniref:G-protein coupled receptors family 1 profile domain-containing protein n=1 Tax=Protopolystoma xenopodis TaxID=117903 RepID=A0A3S5CQ04_9PLAT|nr:unnamed protein product [Protopolystoma xenopodis]